jgi:hypothetical protein
MASRVTMTGNQNNFKKWEFTTLQHEDHPPYLADKQQQQPELNHGQQRVDRG